MVDAGQVLSSVYETPEKDSVYSQGSPVKSVLQTPKNSFPGGYPPALQ